jgi:hypothetical protein
MVKWNIQEMLVGWQEVDWPSVTLYRMKRQAVVSRVTRFCVLVLLKA